MWKAICATGTSALVISVNVSLRAWNSNEQRHHCRALPYILIWLSFAEQNEWFPTSPGSDNAGIYVHSGTEWMCFMLTSWPCTMRWCVVIRALKTTTQLALPTLSISVSTIWGTFTLVWSWVAWIRSGKKLAGKNISEGTEHKLIKQEDRWDGKTEVWWCECGAARSGHCCTALYIPLSTPCDCGCFRFCIWLYVSHFAKWCKLRGSYSFYSGLPSPISKCMQTKSSHYVTAACCDSHWLQLRPAASHLWAEEEAESKRQPELKPCGGRTDGEKLAWWLESAIMTSIRRERNCKSSVQRVSIDLCPYVCDGRGQRESRERTSFNRTDAVEQSRHHYWVQLISTVTSTPAD